MFSPFSITPCFCSTSWAEIAAKGTYTFEVQSIVQCSMNADDGVSGLDLVSLSFPWGENSITIKWAICQLKCISSTWCHSTFLQSCESTAVDMRRIAFGSWFYSTLRRRMSWGWLVCDATLWRNSTQSDRPYVRNAPPVLFLFAAAAGPANCVHAVPEKRAIFCFCLAICRFTNQLYYAEYMGFRDNCVPLSAMVCLLCTHISSIISFVVRLFPRFSGYLNSDTFSCWQLNFFPRINRARTRCDHECCCLISIRFRVLYFSGSLPDGGWRKIKGAMKYGIANGFRMRTLIPELPSMLWTSSRTPADSYCHSRILA